MIRNLTIAVALLTQASAGVITAPDPHSLPQADQTVVWSPLFQATWDAMNVHLGGKPVRVEPPNALMARLDAFQWKPDTVMPKGAWKTWAGPAEEEFLKKVNEEAAGMTGESQGPFRLSDERIPGTIACFGLLDREVEFEKPFYRSTKVPLQFGASKTAVHFFGARGDQAGDYGESVKVLAHRPVDGSHALEISCKGIDDKLILYRPAKPQDFATACHWLREWRKTYQWNAALPGNWDDRLLHKEDEVRVPYVSLDVTDELSAELQGLRYHANSSVPWRVIRAEQKTKFELFEKGAKVRVETSIEAGPFGPSEPKTVPRRFAYDQPFFIFLWRDKAEWPYLGVWVGDASALQKF